MKTLSKHMRLFFILLFFAFSLTAQVSNQDKVSRNYPLIPFNTNFWNYWDHYWTTWLDKHPKYEAIELTTFDNPNNPDYKLIRVFLSEKYGSKRQYYYLNDSIAAKKSKANTFYSNIEYKTSGESGKPQSLYLKFKDKDGELIEWTIDFDTTKKLVKHTKGLTPSIHSVGYVLLYHLRIKTVNTPLDKVLFNGKNYAYQDNRKLSWYNNGAYSAINLYSTNIFKIRDDYISNSWNRKFKKQVNKSIYVSEDLGKQNFIRFEVDNKNQLKKYQHLSFGHALTFDFSPALPNHQTSQNGQIVDFTVSFDNHKNLMKGKVRVVAKSKNKLIFQWKHDDPSWATWRPFKSIFDFNDEGYKLTVYE